MSNLRDSISESNIDANKPSTSSTQPLQSKSSLNDMMNQNTGSPSKSPKHASSSRQKRRPDGERTGNLTNKKSIDDLSNQAANVNIESDSEEELRKNASPNKRKNGKKKEKKKLQLVMPQTVPTPRDLVQEQNVNTTRQQEVSSVKELLMTKISPLYASTSSRYLENLSHHPQYQDMNSTQGKETVQGQHQYSSIHNTPMQGQPQYSSIPNTPMQGQSQYSSIPNTQMQGQHQYSSIPNTPMQGQHQYSSIPNTPLMQQQPRSPQFLQNVMQHPLLSKSFSAGARDQVEKNYLRQQAFYQQQIPHPFLLANSVLANNQEAAKSQQFHPYAVLLANSALANQEAARVQQFHPYAYLIANSALANNHEGAKSPASPGRNRKKNNKSQNKDQKRQPVDDKKLFEPYLSEEEVAEGLKNNTMLQGVLRINPKQFQHSYISSQDRSEKDVLIDGIKHRNRALEGDIVIVQFVKDSESKEGSEENKQKRGKVVQIKEKVHSRTCIGNLKLLPDKNRQKALFVPRDHRIPRINIPCTSWPDNFFQESKKYENTLFQAKILDWSDTRFAVGTIVSLLGQSGDMVTESKAILTQNDLDVTPFGPEMRDLYPRLDYTIPEEEIKIREDCRKMCIFSIDPHNCRDIDDAVSCRQLENGNYEIGVHISDVAYFLAEGTILDEKVADKATTVYLVEKAYHMLPDELCMLCSLFPGVDKLAFSVFWEITKDAKVLSHRFSKTVIHSCCQLAYEHAQAVLDNKDNAQNDFPEIYNGFKYEDAYSVIKTLGSIAAIFRNERFEGGALRIDQPKVSFNLGANGLPKKFSIYESQESHQLIEEFMLLANMTVANRIYEDYPKLSFLRCHPAPNTHMLNELAKSLTPMGIELDFSSAGSLHKSLEPLVSPDNPDRGRAMVLSMLCAKPMARAKYFCAGNWDDDDFKHYALNVPLYTHFTSPIRRYADIMVHRLLAASIKFREDPKWDLDRVRSIAAQCNKQKYNAKKAGEMSTELYTLKYIEMNSPVVTDAVVVEVKEKYIDIIVVALGLNRRIYFNNDFPGKYECLKNDAGSKLSKMAITWNATKTQPAAPQVIEVFSIVPVEMHKGDDMVKVETKLVRPS